MARLTQEFYAQDTVQVARALLGKYVVRRLNGAILAGRITETEAYVGRCDKACHAYRFGKTPRTQALFLPAGHAYLYQIYGLHHCLNIVTEGEGEPAAVLLRSLEPVAGIAAMCRLRFSTETPTPQQRKHLLDGPGKICKGLSLSMYENQMDLTGDVLFLCDAPEDFGTPACPLPQERICCGPRIGIDYAEEARDFPWRFWLEKERE